MLNFLDEKYIKELFNQALEEFEKRNPTKKRPKNLIGFLDVTMITTFDPIFIPSIKKEILKIREKKLKADHWHTKLKRLYDDQTVYLDGNGSERQCVLESMSPVRVVFDKVTNELLEDNADAIIGRTSMNYRFISIGSSNITADINDKALYNEMNRVDAIGSGGSAERNGSTVYWNSFFPKTTISGDIYEIGVHNTNDPTNDKMALRSVLPTADKVQHLNGVDSPNVSVVLYQCPS